MTLINLQKRKLCNQCWSWQTLENFNKYPGNRDGLVNKCRKCLIGYHRNRRRNGRTLRAIELEKQRQRGEPIEQRRAFARAIMRAAGITVEDWARAYNSQNGGCGACRKLLLFDASTAADHNHTTKKFRGLLCQHCNLALGQAKDSVKILAQLVRYLEEHDE